MNQSEFIYRILYALMARDGREERLFGTSAPDAAIAFSHSLAGPAFPELWFEIPLAGDPWFDLHALTARSDLTSDQAFSAEQTGGNPAAFAWFAAQSENVRQLALSWDVGRGDVEHPAVQLLLYRKDVPRACAFLEAAGRPDATDAYRTFVNRIPQGWFACYTGVFPGRPGHNLRVECIPQRTQQQAYAQDAALLEHDLRQTGLRILGDNLLSRCQLLAQSPFPLEFQFDVMPDGSAGGTVSASVRFACPPGDDAHGAFDPQGAAGTLMRQVEAWGLADDRWQLLTDTIISKHLSYQHLSAHLVCYPAFLKLKWQDGEPVDAKAYLLATMSIREQER